MEKFSVAPASWQWLYIWGITFPLKDLHIHTWLQHVMKENAKTSYLFVLKDIAWKRKIKSIFFLIAQCLKPNDVQIYHSCVNFYCPIYMAYLLAIACIHTEAGYKSLYKHRQNVPRMLKFSCKCNFIFLTLIFPVGSKMQTDVLINKWVKRSELHKKPFIHASNCLSTFHVSLVMWKR